MLSTFERLKLTMAIRAFATLKIPLLAWAKPTVVDLSAERTVLMLPLSRRTKNHLNVMYFGALAMGAEAAIAVKCIEAIRQSGHKIDFIFKDFKGEFLKRADGDVHFICDMGREVEALVLQATTNPERLEGTFKSYAIVPSKDPNAHVAEFALTLSIKNRSLSKKA